jgi:hypothetical protein
MLHKKANKKLSILVSVTKEMAKPRIARSAKIAELKLDTHADSRTAKPFHAGNCRKNHFVPTSESAGKGSDYG